MSAKFSYTVNEKSYINGRYAAYRSEVTREDAERIVRDLPIGLKTTCYYDPENPGQAVFKRGRPQYSLTFRRGLQVMSVYGGRTFELVMFEK